MLTSQELDLLLKIFFLFARLMMENSINILIELLCKIAKIFWMWSSQKNSLLVTCIGSSLLIDAVYLSELSKVNHFSLQAICILFIFFLAMNIPIFRGAIFLLDDIVKGVRGEC